MPKFERNIFLGSNTPLFNYRVLFGKYDSKELIFAYFVTSCNFNPTFALRLVSNILFLQYSQKYASTIFINFDNFQGKSSKEIGVICLNAFSR
jgi:hypothetical protein